MSQPIPLGEAGSNPIIFRRVVFRIPVGTVLGEVRMRRQVIDEMRWTIPRPQSLEFNVAVTDGLRAYGYDARDLADSLFDPKGHAKIRYEMAAILHDARLDFEYKYDAQRDRRKEGFGTAEVSVEVQLHDAVRNQTIYTRRFEGRAREEGLKPNPLLPAVVRAILKAAEDPAFVALVARDPSGIVEAGARAEPIQIAACQRDGIDGTQGDLRELLKAVVEIQVGGLGGTGVLVSPDGWIVTAAHVVRGAEEIWVRLDAGAQLPAEVHQADAKSDLALLRIQGRDYPCAPIRMSEEDLALGSGVFAVNIAIGENHEPTVTRGVVSGFPVRRGRRFIQTDASVNPGSSGGPLLSEEGAIAGITVAKVVGDGIEGMGLAIPVHEVMDNLSIRLSEN